MAELSLSITANDLVVVGLGEPLFLLFRCALSLECNLPMLALCGKVVSMGTNFEHAIMKTVWTRLANKLGGSSEFLQ
jgi:hypothetical protein